MGYWKYDMLLQDEGVPLCYYISVKEVMDQKFPQQHTGGGRPCHLATSLYIVGFLLMGVYKECCLHTTITQPLARLVSAATDTPAMLMYVFPGLAYRCDVCGTTDGAVIEHL